MGSVGLTNAASACRDVPAEGAAACPFAVRTPGPVQAGRAGVGPLQMRTAVEGIPQEQIAAWPDEQPGAAAT